jgi:hypothetical protein
MKKPKSAKTSAKSRTPATEATSAAPAPAPKFTGEPRIKAPPPSAPKSRNGDQAAVAVPPAATAITAQIDVGFGNTLFLRGEGPGLSWEKGVPLGCSAGDRWSISLPVAARPVVFKFLLNDKIWSTGEDFVLKPGASGTFTPAF